MNVQHVQVICGNTKVFFPFEPYETQKNYMRSVIEALNNKQNALLESPTGTGKTLSLLCSSLAWIQSQSRAQGQSIVYYTSRTHMQLSQAAKEMRQTAYSRVPAVVIGSRVQMCLNEEVRSTDPNLINRTCRNAIARNACAYYTNYEQKLETMEQNAVHDIEDLSNFGKQHQCCPYYASKKLAETKASVIFMPYNYLMDSSVRKSTQLKIDNSVIIFDEAHNIESALKDSVSGSFTESSLHVVQESCDKLPAKVHEALNKEKHGLSRAGYNPKDKPGSIVNEFAKQKPVKQKEKEVKVNPIEELAEKLTNVKLQEVRNFAGMLINEIKHLDTEKLCSVESIIQIMSKSGIEFSCSSKIITTLDSMASFWSIAGVVNPSFVAKHVSAISNLSHVLSIIFPEVCTNLGSQKEHEKRLIEFYSVYVKGVHEYSNHLAQGRLKDKEVNLWCLHPALGLKKVFESTSIFGPRSMIVTSGTLEPMKSIQKELEMDFKIQRSFGHVIGTDQLKMLLVNESFNKFQLSSDFKSAQSDKFPGELGSTLQPLIKILPYGTLIFFPSYTLMNKVIHSWKNKTNIWKDMAAVSSLYIEQSSSQDQFMSDVGSYKRITSGPNPERRAVFFCVCRGKLSEGINLEGNHCRTVIVVGLPFPNARDPRVMSTKSFQERRNNKYWYSEQMRRALNQTIGRVIRSRTDFGLLLLVDPRFRDCKFSLSEWTRPFYPSNYVRMSHLEREIKEFFSPHGINIAGSMAQSVGAFDIGFAANNDWLGSDSPFTEEEEDFNIGQTASKTKVISAQERQDAMVAQYRDARQRLRAEPAQVRNKSPQDNNPKRQKTTLDAFESIYAQSENFSSSHTISHVLSATSSQSNSSYPSASQTNNPARSNLLSRGTQGTRSNPLAQKTQPSTDSSTTSEIQNDQSNPLSQNIPPVQDVRPTQSAQPPQSVRPTLTTQSTATTQGTVSSLNYSITKQASDKDRPTTYTCCICKNEATRPHSTMCPCDRVGCYNCLLLLAGKKCFKCGTTLRKRDFKPRLFKSAFFQNERTPVIVID